MHKRHHILKFKRGLRWTLAVVLFLRIFTWFFDFCHVIIRYTIIRSKNRLHHSIPRSRFTPYSHENKWPAGLQFLSVVGIFPNFRHFPLFKLKFQHCNLKISAMWRHREFSSTNSESVNKALSDSGVEFMIRPGLVRSYPHLIYGFLTKTHVY